MPEYRKKSIKVFALAALCLVFSGCGENNGEWGVLVNGLPEKVVPEWASRSVEYYILRQTHEPLFRLDDGENYNSRLLRKWNRSISDGGFDLCPNTALKFDEAHLFSMDYFAAYISSAVLRYDPHGQVRRNGECFHVSFSRNKNDFLEFMTKYENAPSIKKTDRVQLGLGPYSVSRIDEKTIELARKVPVSRGYNKIILYEYEFWKRSGSKDKRIADFNRISSQDIPVWVARQYTGFNNVTLKSGNLIINHKNKRIRELIYNCVNVSKFRQAYFPQKKEFYSIKTVFPMGVPGGIPGLAEQTCSEKVKKGLAGTEFVFANWREDNLAQIAEFARDFTKSTGVTMKVMNSTPQELMKTLHKSPRPYNAIVMHLDAIRAEQPAFFEVFLESDGYLDFNLPKIAAMNKGMKKEADPKRRDLMGATIAEMLKQEAVVLPLYQEERAFYYPKAIRNLNVGVGFIEYPEVADFRW